MTLMRSEPHHFAARLCALALLTLAGVAGLLVGAPAASALSCTPISDFPAPPPMAPLPGSCFEGFDGNQVDPDGATPAPPAAPNRLDWGSAEVLPAAQKSLDYTQGSTDSQFTQGTEEVPDSWKWGMGTLGSDKYNFISGYSYQEPGTQDLMFAMGFVRESNNGTSWLAFELNQLQPGYRTEPLVGAVPARDLEVPTRSTGDLLITYSVSNNNSPKPIIGLCKWAGDEHTGKWTDMAGTPVASNCPPMTAATAQADLNGADIPAAQNFLGSPAGTLQAGTFGEAVINLTEAFKAAGANPSTADDCLSFGYFWAHSRSSEPITSQQQDFILPEGAINVANCAVNGTKWHDRNGNGLVDGTDVKLGGWTIYADYNDNGVLDAGEPSDVTAPASPSDSRPLGTYTLSDLADGTYKIREVAQTGWTCTSPSPCATEVTMTGAVINSIDFLNFDPQPAIVLEKTATLNQAGAFPVPGDTIGYGFEITNTGNVTLTGVDLTDALLGKSDATCGATTLAVGAKTTCTATYPITQADINAGKVDNTATACGDPPAGTEVCDPDGTSTPLARDPDIELEKTGVLDRGADGKLQAGDEIDYTFKITNDGNVTLTGVDLTDALVGLNDATCTATTLAPGAFTTCTASYSLTQADLNNGTVTNNATACGDPPAGAEVCDPDATTTPLPASPGIALLKTGALDDGANNTLEAGDKIEYAFEITNTGNVTLTGVDLTDAVIGFSDATCGVTTLAPGAKTTCTATYTITQADIDAGSKTNNATACGDPPTGTEVCDPDSTTTPLDPSKRIDLEKTNVLDLGANGTLEAGDKIQYSFEITNTGNVTLTGVDLTDALLGFNDATCGATTLTPGAKTTCTANYTLTQADLDRGSVTNTGTACGDPPVGTEVCDPDSTTTVLPASPSIALEKTGVLDKGANGTLEAGDKIQYSFEITNTGNVTLTGVDLTDALVGFSDASCGVTVLAPGAKTTCTVTYTLKQADLDAGRVDNTATACGDAPSGTEVCDPDSASVLLPAAPAIALEKTGVLDKGADGKLQAGDEVDYTFEITNTGNVTLTGVDLTDALLGKSDATCGATTLAPGAKTTCTASYTLTQADLNAGRVDNTATACGDPPAGAEVCDPDSASVLLPASPAIVLEKTGVLDRGANGTLEAGDEVDYAFEITNTGNVTLTGVDLTDALIGYTDATCGATSLAPGAKTTCTASYQLTQADLDAGFVSNTATACGDAPSGTEVCDPDAATVQLPAAPAIALEKTGVLDKGANGTLEAGDEVDYTFEITNTGNVTLSGVDLTDALVGFSDATCGVTSLAPGAKTTCTATYKVTQADIDAGKVDNTATACGDAPSGAEVCDPDSTSTPLVSAPGITLVKTGVLNAPAAPKAGDTITYTFEITNSGNVTLTGSDLDDALVGFANATCGKTTLLPGEKTSCTTGYTVTQADIDAGKVDNLATVCADPPAGPEVCDPDDTSTPLPSAPAITLEKTGVLNAAAAPKAGDTITYTFEITNTGNVTLTGTDLTDALVGFADATCGATTLAPGAKTSCTATYTLTQADIDAGKVDNLATACADPPAGPEVCDPDDTSTPLVPAPGIALEKTGVLNAPAAPKAGDTITYTFLVTNTGNVTLTGADLDDALVGFADALCGVATLAPGATTTCTADYTVTQADLDAGKVDNVATVCADPPAGPEVCDPDDTTTPLDPDKGILVEKDGPATAYHGDSVTYTFLVSNTGNATLANVTVTDDKCAPVQGPVAFVKGDDDNLLEIGEQWRYTCTTKVPAHAAGEANPIVNTVTASGTDGQGNTVSDTDTHATLVLHPAVDIVKTGPASGVAGQPVGYTLTVTNPGDVPLVGETLSVTDPACEAPPQLQGKFRGDVADPTPDDLDPGDRWVYTCTVQTVAGQGQVVNTGFVTGEDPNKVKVSDEDTVTTPLAQPQIQVLPEVVESGVARLTGPSRCVSKAFRATVRGKRIKKVVWRIDGRRYKTYTSRSGTATRVTLRVNPRRFGKGVHRLSARITYHSASRTRARTLRMTFQQCARKIIAPKFTG